MCEINGQKHEFNNETKNLKFTQSCFEWVESLVSALIVTILVLTFIFKTVIVDGQSMENTLFDHERLIVSNICSNLKNGDIVVIGPIWSLSEHVLIKRVIAVEGQTLDINFDTGKVTVDGVVLDEPYIKEITRLREDGKIPKVIPKDFVFVMGDNRNHSIDSRSSSLGLVHKNEVRAKAKLVIFPFNRIRAL